MSFPTIAGDMSEDGLSGFRSFQISGAVPSALSLSSRGPRPGSTSKSSMGAVGGWIVLFFALGLVYMWVNGESKQVGHGTTVLPAVAYPTQDVTQEPVSLPTEIEQRLVAAPIKPDRKPAEKTVAPKKAAVTNAKLQSEPKQPMVVEQFEDEEEEASIELREIRDFKSKM